jgi:hypothetical protein
MWHCKEQLKKWDAAEATDVSRWSEFHRKKHFDPYDCQTSRSTNLICSISIFLSPILMPLMLYSKMAAFVFNNREQDLLQSHNLNKSCKNCFHQEGGLHLRNLSVPEVGCAVQPLDLVEWPSSSWNVLEGTEEIFGSGK